MPLGLFGIADSCFGFVLPFAVRQALNFELHPCCPCLDLSAVTVSGSEVLGMDRRRGHLNFQRAEKDGTVRDRRPHIHKILKPFADIALDARRLGTGIDGLLA